MKVGVGLPASLKGADGPRILEWAVKADAGPFSSVAVIDRLVYRNYDPLVTLAAVAAVTRRVRLTTAILLAPLRNPGVMAKQAASIDALSGGRLTLGLGVGSREDDFLVAPAPFKGRGRRFEEQLDLMKRVWSGKPVGEGVGPVGPAPGRPGGPELLIGGRSQAAVARAGRLADGYIASPYEPSGIPPLYRVVEEAWKAAGKPGRPRLVGIFFFALGPNGAEAALSYMRDYYAWRGALADQLARNVLTTREAIATTLRGFADVGMDELLMLPCLPGIDQVDRLADIVA
jgi:alkanesulfonate monooxygenase SsuD/methylene tetrahydromethanopterin reductase-like flavin-dependent oxidoreductase (luciferase family)